jgi:type IV pilus assembly protein PilM
MGSKYIRTVLGRRAGQSISIIDYGSYEVQYNINDYSKSKNDLVDGISKIIRRMTSKHKDVYIGVKGPNIITRHITLPVMKEKFLRQAAEYEFKQYLPLVSDDYVIGCKVSQILKGSRYIDMLMAAVPKRIVNYNIDIADSLGLSIKSIDIFADSITRLFNCGIFGNASLLLVDMGYEYTDIIIVEEGKLYFHRCLSIGCGSLVERDQQCQPYFNENVLDELIDNMLEVIDFYSSSRPGRGISHLYLYGDGAGIVGLSDYINNIINIETSVLYDRVVGNIRNVDKYLSDNIHSYLNCLSLLLKYKSI